MSGKVISLAEKRAEHERRQEASPEIVLASMQADQVADYTYQEALSALLEVSRQANRDDLFHNRFDGRTVKFDGVPRDAELGVLTINHRLTDRDTLSILASNNIAAAIINILGTESIEDAITDAAVQAVAFAAASPRRALRHRSEHDPTFWGDVLQRQLPTRTIDAHRFAAGVLLGARQIDSGNIEVPELVTTPPHVLAFADPMQALEMKRFAATIVE